MIPDKKRAAAEARALQMTLVLAASMDWHFSPGPMPTTSFAQFLYVEAAQLLLVPTTAGLDYAIRQVEPVVREARSDAIIVSRPGSAAPVFAFAAWARCTTAWVSPLELWRSASGESWLAPVGDEDKLGIPLRNGLHHAAAVPWASEDERQLGRHRALGWLARSERVDP